jgi:phosphopentomutase
VTTLKRAVLVVLDGVGAGSNPDAATYGDEGASSLEHCAQAIGGLELPHLGSIGLGNITPILGTPARSDCLGAYGRLNSIAAGKDSVAGHWEMTGVVLRWPLPTYPGGFPPEIVTAFEQTIGRKVIGNKVASGTEIIKELGEEHMRTSAPILYTSADSQGYAQALRDVDNWVPLVQQRMQPGDAIFFSADHGVDPTYRGTDHTRESVPLLAYGRPIRPSVNLGARSTLADLGQTLAEAFGIPPLTAGTSFAHQVGLD